MVHGTHPLNLGAGGYMISITKEFTFDAAHRLYLIDRTPEENHAIFGKCCKIHGHTYLLRITVTGSVDDTGMIIHFSQLKSIVRELVIDRYDHTMLNEIDEFKDIPPTAEVMAGHIFTLLENRLGAQSIALSSVVLYETPTSWATVTGDA
ncbi:MAG: 6-pyruvoyltetrahydropterin/6-carboxytetrahydropterin synthase [Desulforhopalus sp.]|jgi:6-pyruvoyltetrahydropterin/6-carboxytetrahydropterin synthase